MVKTIILKFDKEWFEAFKKEKERVKAKSWEAFFMEQIFHVTEKRKAEAKQ